ncbi:MAG: glycosyltransferase family 2 protein [Paenibacillus macerans]|uniref:Glycosyl transferase 2 family protein n=1 Tax=Paenibacillus macerans TaxID=44252 RepID=A0A090ZPI4_PAEMA|nr:glycosyltransferase family 2 protein [Paenibacillus macerans]KFN12155.1 glycosyl transferase 2 family protein [Paenibacillus macerans]MCY7561227.1 glycosyltransferase family 2 protein [Paenibacillus macerans]MDU7474385.1 glycosyltransferase family 2 protein [Paenibacillus macerans]MEC0150207.1 glycosyltransferase family 2 protein [Paenibacillus macerans]MEC0329493.1 glycosyltransferase family 2 protein [Paenibacillus macerans]
MSGGILRILIGSPIRQQPEILQRFLASLANLERTSYEAVFFFIDDNDDPASAELLQKFSSHHAGTIIKRMTSSSDYIRNDTTHYWNEHLVWKVAGYKNIFIQHAREQQFDGLFLVDSDILLHPHTIEQLLEAKVDIVSEVFWTRWQPEAEPQPQVWLQDEYTQWVQKRGEQLNDEQIAERYKSFIDMLRTPGFYEVGGLGACTLIGRRALDAGVNFRPIPNLSFWGEDRHFCIRAAALGLSLYADTHFPAYHIYRNSDLPGADDFLAHYEKPTPIPVRSEKNTKAAIPSASQPDGSGCADFLRRHLPLTLSMIVRNEAGRYLKQALQEHSAYIGQAVVIDDGSTDESVDVVMDTLQGLPVKLVRNSRSKFDNEVELRRQQWQETIRTDPTWILNLDADEWFERRFAEEIEGMLQQNETDVFCFRLYDFWNATHYREDAYWRSHLTYRPFLVRYRPSFTYRWKETPQHCGRFPANIFELPHRLSPLRVKHFGWAKEEDRHEKLHRYRELDPGGAYGWREQYDSILDPVPNLVEWTE